MYGLIKREDLTVSSLGLIFVIYICMWMCIYIYIYPHTYIYTNKAPGEVCAFYPEGWEEGGPVGWIGYPTCTTNTTKEVPFSLPTSTAVAFRQCPFLCVFPMNASTKGSGSGALPTHSFLHWANTSKEVMSHPQPLAWLLQIQGTGTLWNYPHPSLSKGKQRQQLSTSLLLQTREQGEDHWEDGA